MQKVILGKTLSPKTSEIVSGMESEFRLPVKYYPASERPNKSDSIYGSVDPYGAGGFYKVWLRVDITDELFETNLLHELTHIAQFEYDYPIVCSKNSSVFYSSDHDFIDELGAHLGSTVLDIDVQERLLERGYANCEFAEENAARLIAASGHDCTRLNDPLNYAMLVVSLLMVASLVSRATRDALCTAYGRYTPVVADVRFLYDKIQQIGTSTPEKAAASLGAIIDHLSLWPYYLIYLDGKRIRTPGEYSTFLREYT